MEYTYYTILFISIILILSTFVDLIITLEDF